MLRRLSFGFVGAVLGYVVGLFGGMAVISLFSENHFDRSMEAAMTGAFVFGPIVALVGLVVGVLRGKPRPPIEEGPDGP